MSMRITNKIMQRNNLSNLNINKTLEDKLTTQISTGKVVNRPSDDPVVAIRALRLRSNVTEVTQYYSKNIPDAESWMTVTEDALTGLSTVLTSMISQVTKGANGDLTSDDRGIIMTQLQALSSEVYATGDADYAGRYVFTGYRTDTSLSFMENTTVTYSITEQVNKGAIDSFTFVNDGNITDWTASNFNSITTDETAVSESTVHRIRLSYDKCDPGMDPSIEYYDGGTDGGGNPTTATMTATTISLYDDPSPYEQVATASGPIYVPETGEILLDDASYNTLMNTKDNAATGAVDEAEIRVVYKKTDWLSTDLRPEHYFYCVDETNHIEYNTGYLDHTAERQSIEYDVGFNTTIRVNSLASDCFKLGVGREIADLVKALEQVTDLETTKSQIEAQIAATDASDTATLATLNTQLAQADKALTYAKDTCQKRFESGITALQGYLDDTNLSITSVGSRTSKLELIESRMQNQKTTFETLQSENEDIDVTEAAINLASANVTYQAALAATGKIMQNTLLNYI